MECQSCSSSTTHRRTNYISIFTSFFSDIFQLILQEYRIFYIQLFSVRCSKCGFNFLYTYHTFDLSNCPNCNGEFCKYCMEEYDSSKHDKQKCYRRYLMLYFVGLLAFMALYLKFIFLCNSHAVTKYSMVTIFLCEYIMFYNEVDSFLSNCISLKNIVLGIILLIYYNEGDIIFYILVGIIQMICIVLINNISEQCRKGMRDMKQGRGR